MKPTPPSDLWEQLESVRGERRAQPPADAFNQREYAAKFGLTRNVAEGELEQLITEGMVERAGKFLVNGHHTIYYRMKNGRT